RSLSGADVESNGSSERFSFSIGGSMSNESGCSPGDSSAARAAMAIAITVTSSANMRVIRQVYHEVSCPDRSHSVASKLSLWIALSHSARESVNAGARSETQ